jgi:AraC-like DNA-binding protein
MQSSARRPAGGLLPEPMTVHLAHYRHRLAGILGVPPRVNANWMIYLPMRGHRFRCALGVREARGPMWYLIPPGFAFAVDQPLGYEHYSAHFSANPYLGWEATVAASQAATADGWPDSPLADNPVTLELADARWRLCEEVRRRSELLAAFSRLIAHFQQGDRFRARLALVQLLERISAITASSSFARIAPFTEHLTCRAHEPASIDALARACGMSRMQLHRCCQQAYGAAPRELILRERLALAQLLLDSGQSVHVVARTSGFEDPYYFSRLFARRMGCPPSRWQGRKNRLPAHAAVPVA